MYDSGTLQHCDEALRFIEKIEDLATRSLVNMAFVHLVKRTHLQKRDLPQTDVDMGWLVRALAEYFAEHRVISRALEGEAVGVWDEAKR